MLFILVMLFMWVLSFVLVFLGGLGILIRLPALLPTLRLLENTFCKLLFINKKMFDIIFNAMKFVRYYFKFFWKCVLFLLCSLVNKLPRCTTIVKENKHKLYIFLFFYYFFIYFALFSLKKSKRKWSFSFLHTTWSWEISSEWELPLFPALCAAHMSKSLCFSRQRGDRREKKQLDPTTIQLALPLAATSSLNRLTPLGCLTSERYRVWKLSVNRELTAPYSDRLIFYLSFLFDPIFQLPAWLAC